MKIVTLCREGLCYPVVKVTDERTKTGEKDSIYISMNDGREILKQKIINKEVEKESPGVAEGILRKDYGPINNTHADCCLHTR